MRIRDKAGGPRGLKLAEMDEKVWFDDKGVADVPADVGRMLCERFETIEPVRKPAKKKEA